MKVAILGLGVVGQGVYDILTKHDVGITPKYVLELDKEKLKGKEHLLAPSFDTILEDEEVEAVIELIGGKTVAYEFIKQALQHNKHVVTANKAVVSAYYQELEELCQKHNVSIFFEASVGGGINVLESLKTFTTYDDITSIEGIINGSTNFVLTNVFENNMSFDDALTKAEELGYIETGSTDDMDGYDLLRKINILSILSYTQFIKEEDIIRVPLSSLTNEFVAYVKKRNLVLKYIATSTKKENKIMIHLEPTILTKENPYSSVDYENNIITIDGTYHPAQSFLGKGAGRYPTASAVVNDLLHLKNKKKTELVYRDKFALDKTLMKYPFLVLENGTFTVTKPVTFEEVISNPNITCFARIGEEAFEKL